MRLYIKLYNYKVVILHGKFLAFSSNLHLILLQRVVRISGEHLFISFSWAVLEKINVMDPGEVAISRTYGNSLDRSHGPERNTIYSPRTPHFTNCLDQKEWFQGERAGETLPGQQDQ